MEKFITTICFCLWATILLAQKGFSFKEDTSKKQLSILYNGKLMTAYCYFDSVAKPVLYPVNTIDGITVTRGYPKAPRPGERTDHPHHIGIWMNYESVNGIDFWNNSTAIEPNKRDHYGTIRHQKIIYKKSSGNRAEINTTAGWYNNQSKQLLKEFSKYNFKIENKIFIIDRSTTLTALGEPVVFKDIKDGFFAIRVASELEMPSDKEAEFIDAHGIVTKVKPSGERATGMYYNSNGLKGDSVWSSQARWAVLKGKKDGKPISIAMIDNPSNIGYPTYWHARGYGLFALNPLGRNIFSNGKETLNLTLKPGQSVTFKYRIAIASKDLSNETINALADSFK